MRWVGRYYGHWYLIGLKRMQDEQRGDLPIIADCPTDAINMWAYQPRRLLYHRTGFRHHASASPTKPSFRFARAAIRIICDAATHDLLPTIGLATAGLRTVGLFRTRVGLATVMVLRFGRMKVVPVAWLGYIYIYIYIYIL